MPGTPAGVSLRSSGSPELAEGLLTARRLPPHPEEVHPTGSVTCRLQ